MRRLTNIVQGANLGRVRLVARFFQQNCYWCHLFLASAFLLSSYVYAGDGLSQSNLSQPTRVLPSDKPKLEPDDAQGALEFLCSIQQSNILAMGPLELTMSEVVSIVGSESSTPLKQYELTIKHRETTIAGQLRSNALCARMFETTSL